MNSNWSYCPETLNSGQNQWFFCPVWPWHLMTFKNNRAPLLCCIKLCASFRSHRWIQTGVTVPKHSIWVKINDFFVPCDLEIWWMTSIGHLFYVDSSSMHHFIAISEFNLKLQSGNTQFGSKSAIIFVQCDLEIWRMTLTNNRALLLCYFKLCASFHSHWWIKTGVTVQKWPIWVKTDNFLSGVPLKFDEWPWKTIGHLS